MNREVDYAEMLEIPVSTVNVVKKKRRRAQTLENRLFDSVNERVMAEEDGYSAQIAENTPVEDHEVKAPFAFKRNSKESKIFIAEFVGACFLCSAIFITNILMPNSFFNSLAKGVFGVKSGEEADLRSYSDFTLSGIVGDFSDVEVAVSNSGVMSFTAKSAIYPVCDGVVESVIESEDGYTMVISHSSTFESIITGMTTPYCVKGDEVKGNLPVGYSDGEMEVSVMLYDNDSLLSCFSVNDGNSIIWND